MKIKTKKSENKKDIDLNVARMQLPIVFNGLMRKSLVEGVLQDIKGRFEMMTDGKVSVIYEDFNIKNHEFGFKIQLLREDGCKKQMFNEVSCALVNAFNYMFPADNDEYDVSFCTSKDKVEVEFVSNW